MGYGHSPESHKDTRKGQKQNLDKYHHPQEKINQLEKFSKYTLNKDILEVFGGQGNLTRYYESATKEGGSVTSLTKEDTGNSFDYIYKLRGERKKYGVIDIDSYGYPDKFFPVVFEMMRDECLLVFTFPIVGVNCLNGITEQHFINFWRSPRPTIGDVTGVLTDFALRNWYLISLKDVVRVDRIYRFVFECKRVKATEMCNTRNR